MTGNPARAMRRAFVRSSLCAGALLAAGSVFAQAASPASAPAADYPRRPVTIVVPFTAGGAVDVTARAVAQLLTRQLGQPFVVENRVGAGGMVGLASVARAAPDGYTLGWGANSPMTVSPYVSKSPQYDPAKAFAPVSVAAISSWVLAARPGLQANSVAELVALAKARPGQVTFGSTGIGSVPHLLGETLKSTAGIDMLHVPFKGEIDAVNAMLGGQVDVFMATTSTSTPLIKAGRLKGLAVTTPRRDRVVPDIATMAEAGFPDLTFEFFVGLVAPAGTPAPVIGRLAGAMKQVVAEPSFNEAMEKGGITPTSTTPEEFAALMARHSARWQQIIRKNAIAVD